MSRMRLFLLTAGPVFLVAASYWATMTDALRGGVPLAGQQAPRPADEPPPALAHACDVEAGRLRERLGPGCRVVIRPPYVLAGDLEEEALADWHARVIAPAAACLRREFFDREPNAPVAIILCSGDASYARFAARLDGRTSSLWYGYYQRDERRVVVNVSTGEGTLVHELVHALAHVDCPGLPEWFDEGLASLYEQCRFSADGRRLEGLSNWRLAPLRRAIEHNELQPLARLAAPGSIRRALEAIDYAHARYLCLYLQERGVLATYYRRLRDRLDFDPGGTSTLCDVLRVASPEAIDHDFVRWALTLR